MTLPYGTAAVWVAFAAVGIATYLFRLSFVPLLDRLGAIPPRVAGTLRFIPPAVFASLLAPRLVSVSAPLGATPHLAYAPPELLAAGLAALVAWRTRNLLATIGVGMLALWAVRALA